MNVEILSHDVATGEARIKFSHLDVVHEDNYDLKLVIPGSKLLMEQWGQEFTEEMQLKALDRLTEWIQSHIESGALKNRLPDPDVSTPPITPPI